jgi:hypothetical protein
MFIEHLFVLMLTVGFMCLIFGLGAWFCDCLERQEEEGKLKEEVKNILHRFDDLKE